MTPENELGVYLASWYTWICPQDMGMKGGGVGTEDKIYRQLQRHLDKQAVGFPATRSGADVRFLKRLFTPDEARLALNLSYRPTLTEDIIRSAAPEFPADVAERLLDSMQLKGAIGLKTADGLKRWYVMPMVVGMYEAQDGSPAPGFLADAGAYMGTLAFQRAFMAVEPSQMRTIPVNESIAVKHNVASYEEIRGVLGTWKGPFVILRCICRESKALRKEPCKKTSRLETCLAMGDMAAAVRRRGHGREVSREEALAILEQNQAEGLVLQPANAQKPEFVCSCCGCCCGMLGFLKMLPHPVDFWTCNFHAEVNLEACSGCGKCLSRCQMGALELEGPDRKARVNLSRCIGCGLCVPTCPMDAMRLVKNEAQQVPPEDEEALYDEVMAHKKGLLGQLGLLIKVGLRMRR
jgi:electron transport complex protein RnfB